MALLLRLPNEPQLAGNRVMSAVLSGRCFPRTAAAGRDGSSPHECPLMRRNILTKRPLLVPSLLMEADRGCTSVAVEDDDAIPDMKSKASFS